MNPLRILFTGITLVSVQFYLVFIALLRKHNSDDLLRAPFHSIVRSVGYADLCYFVFTFMATDMLNLITFEPIVRLQTGYASQESIE